MIRIVPAAEAKVTVASRIVPSETGGRVLGPGREAIAICGDDRQARNSVPAGADVRTHGLGG